MAETKDEPVVKPVCATCHGHGLIDRRCADDPYGSETCPDCNAEDKDKLIAALDGLIAAQHTRLVANEQRINALLEEVDALRKDAERYRWLRSYFITVHAGDPSDKAPGGEVLVRGYGNWGDEGEAVALDAAIDASLSSGRSGSGEAT